MSIFTRLAIASLLLFLSQWSIAQPITLSLPFVNNAQPDQVINMPVSVTGFSNIASMQYVLSWDPQVLKFLTVDNYALPGLNAGNFNAVNAVDSGFVRVLYEAPNSTSGGVSVANGSNIFRLRLRVIGPLNSSTPVSFTEKYPTSMEIARVEGQNTVQYVDSTIGQDHGFVAVGFTVGSQEAQGESTLPVKVFPNPFSDNAKVLFDLPESGEVSVQLSDISGNILHSESNWWAAGSNAFVLENGDFPAKGTYFLIIKTASQYCIRPLFLF